jgi:hypothetical protein
MSHQGLYWRLFFIAILLSPPLSSPATACGWWGDGEAADSDDAIAVDGKGQPIVLRNPLMLSPMKVPQAMGFGIAVNHNKRAVPYLEGTGGLAANKIGQLAKMGYAAVIDLGTPESVATLHRRETMDHGMRYFNITGGETSWSQKDIIRFATIVNENTNLPLLVFGQSRSLLGRIWTGFRLSQGANNMTAHEEGRLLGLPEGEKITPPALN